MSATPRQNHGLEHFVPVERHKPGADLMPVRTRVLLRAYVCLALVTMLVAAAASSFALTV